MEYVRKWVQTVMAFLTNGYWAFPFSRTIYQGPLKVLCSPGLNCYSCPAATLYCPLGSLQQLFAGIRISLENGQYFFGFYVIGSIGVIGSIFGRMVCGWICPFGLMQELLHKIPTGKKIPVPRPLRHVKYAFLLFLVILLPLLVVDEFGAGFTWFCKYVCPAGTLEAGIPMLFLQPGLRDTVGILFYNKLAILIGVIAWSIWASRPFCRTMCPLGAFYALFSGVNLIQLKWDEKKCTHCQACHHVCPMGIKFDESPRDRECITCLKCMSKACTYGAIRLEVGGFSLEAFDRRKMDKNVVRL